MFLHTVVRASMTYDNIHNSLNMFLTYRKLYAIRRSFIKENL